MNTLINKEIFITLEKYYNILTLYIFNQHTVNRRLAGTKTEEIKKINEEDLSSVLNNKKNISDLFYKSNEIINEHSFDLIRLCNNKRDKFVIKQKLLPRNNILDDCQILILIDFAMNTVTFVPINETNNLIPHFSFAIAYNNNIFSINIESSELSSTPSSNWLKAVLFNKLLKWLENDIEETKLKSLSLINLEEYSKLYCILKEKYGKEMVRIWPENTDPLKFVYEDVAIATYLILLWKDEREKIGLKDKQSFVDIGCGNGLLVYLLFSEGHPGYGIDLRKRKIWDLYPKEVELKIESIIPSKSYMFPNIDWIIGNHSDELSPWIPVITARSSYNARYFLLPCCAFQFDGTKFQRKNSRKSQYHEFLEYAEEISNVCGFVTKIDRLKIPSTKRICLIGDQRIYNKSEFHKYAIKIQVLIDSNSKIKFIPRKNIEDVKNCTTVDKSITKNIVERVFGEILKKKRFCEQFQKWNCGGSISLSEIPGFVSSNNLKQLKSECGGLQTLLKNHHQIFHVYNGKVQLRIPKKQEEKFNLLNKKDKKNVAFKSKSCWFFLNHPDGCPLDEKDCSFKHLK